MRKRFALIAGLALASTAFGSTPAQAQPIDQGHFHDVFTNTFDCGGTPVQADGEVSGNFLFNQRGSSAFPYYRESVHGTVVYTNLVTGGTLTYIFTANSKDQTIVDNGDGTITITTFGAGGGRYLDQNGTLVLKNPGEIRYAIDINYNGTPGNPDDDQSIDGSFRIVRDSTGVNITGSFCANLVTFTS